MSATISLDIGSVYPSPTAREVRHPHVAALAESMKEIGLRTPITVRSVMKITNGRDQPAWEIVAGHHRYEAAVRLGWRQIEAIQFDGAELDAELWEIDENLMRSELTEMERARALARRRFAGRGLLVTLMGAPFLLPVIVAVLGLLAVFGRSGVFNDLLALMGLPRLSIYGLHGVVLAHVFLNLPLATRMILQGWQAIPAERFRLAQSLSMGPGAVFRHLELPMLRATLPGAAVAVFVICLTSFAVALTLGGGPGATTVELAIYQALRFDFDPARAAALSALQFALCAGAVALGWRALQVQGFGAGLGRRMAIPAPGGWRRAGDALAIAASLRSSSASGSPLRQ